MRGADLTKHTKPYDQGHGLFSAAGQAEKRQLVSDVTGFRPSTQPSMNPFPNAVNHEAGQPQHLTTQHDEATMRSLRFPFNVNNRR